MLDMLDGATGVAGVTGVLPRRPLTQPNTEPDRAGLYDELRRGLAEQARVVHALVLRETRTRFGNQQLGYFWAFFEPVMLIITFYLLFQIAERQMPLGMDIISFISTGLVPFLAFRTITQRTLKAAESNQALLTYPSVKQLDLVIARFVLEAATFSVIFVVLLGVSSLFAGDGRPVDDLLSVIVGMVAACALGGAFGVLMSGLAMLWPSIEKLQAAVMRPLFWVSGVFFTTNDLPEQARAILVWNPVLHVVDVIRDGFFPTYTAVHASPGYVLIWILACAAAGLHIQRYALRHASS